MTQTLGQGDMFEGEVVGYLPLGSSDPVLMTVRYLDGLEVGVWGGQEFKWC